MEDTTREGVIYFGGKVSELPPATGRVLVGPCSRRSCSRRGRSGPEILCPE